MFCKKCGAKIEDDAVFCTNCGSPVDSVSQSAAQADGSPAPAGSRPDSGGAQEQPVRKPFPVKAVIGVVVGIVLLLTVVFVLLWRRSDDEPALADASEETVEADTDAESGAEAEPVIEEEEKESEPVIEEEEKESEPAADGGADEAADAEEEPAEEEPIAEEKTVDLDAVMKAYESYIKYDFREDNAVGLDFDSFDSFYLVCLNDDDIPELVMSGAGVNDCQLMAVMSYSEKTKNVYSQAFFKSMAYSSTLTLCYDERENHFCMYADELLIIGNEVVREIERWNLFQIAKSGAVEDLGEASRYVGGNSWSIPSRTDTTEEIFNDFLEKNCSFASEIANDYLSMYRSVDEAYAAYLEGLGTEEEGGE